MKLSRPVAAVSTILCFACAAPLATAVPAPAADDTTQALVVNGEVIPEDAVRRELVYRLGLRDIETRKLEIYIATELERRGLESEDLLGEEEVEQAIARQLGELDAEYGEEGAQETVLKSNNLTREDLRHHTRLAMLFNLLYLPSNPEDWPELSRSALEATMPEEQREVFFQRLQEGYEQRVKDGTETGPNDPKKVMFNTFMRQPILAALAEQADIRTAVDGIPPHLAMVVGDVEVTTDEMFERVKDRVSPIEWERTRMWLVKTTAVRQDLEANDAYLSDEEFDSRWKALEEKYANSIIQLPQLALGFKRFPSMDSYRTYRRLLESYQGMIEDELTDENLSEHIERANLLLGLAQVDTEFILLSAYDHENGSWKEGGWADAAKRATEVAQKLAEGEDWDALLVEYSDFWDPPIPKTKQGTEGVELGRRNQGRFGMRNRNALLPLLDENDYMNFLLGSSVTDTVFFDQEVGTVGGPYRGVLGYYLSRVKGRRPATKVFSLEDSSQREGIAADYVQVHFNEYAERVVREADVSGL